MQYYIATSFGTAKFVNTFHLFHALFGIGQGSTNEPPGWTCIVDPVLKCYNKMAHGCTLICSEQKISAKANADMFVDNATLLHNVLVFHTTVIQLMQQIKHDSELWGCLVWTTGGLLKFRKSTYFLVIWMFTSAGAPSITKEDDLPQNQVKLQDTNGNVTSLQQVSSYNSMKMLGVHKAATLDDTIEFNNLHNALKVFTCALSACPYNSTKYCSAIPLSTYQALCIH
eukprot:2116388-Ditylum_brightwellii.AAC.1